MCLNSLKAELNPICHLLALLGVHHILHVSRVRVNAYTTDVEFSMSVGSQTVLTQKSAIFLNP